MAVAILFEAAIVFFGPSTSVTPVTAAIDPIGGQNITITAPITLPTIPGQATTGDGTTGAIGKGGDEVTPSHTCQMRQNTPPGSGPGEIVPTHGICAYSQYATPYRQYVPPYRQYSQYRQYTPPYRQYSQYRQYVPPYSQYTQYSQYRQYVPPYTQYSQYSQYTQYVPPYSQYTQYVPPVIDTLAPSVTSFTATTPTNGTSITYTLLFDESVTGLTAADFTLSGTSHTSTPWSVSNVAGSAGSYTITVSATAPADGTVLLVIGVGTVADGVGNSGPTVAADATTVTIDRTAPTVSSFTRTSASPTNGTSIEYSLVFSESVTGIAVGDLTIGGTSTAWSAAVAGSGSTYTVTLSSVSPGDGTVTLSLGAGAVIDIAANSGPAGQAAAPSTTIDRTAPTVTSFAATTASPTNGTSIAYSLVFSESVSGLAAGDFTVSGTSNSWSAAVTGSGTTYTVTLTGTTPSDGTVIATLNDGAVADAAGNTAPAAPVAAAAVTVDRTAPTVSAFACTPAAGLINTTSLSCSVTFSESVTGFAAASDLVIGGAAATFGAGATSGSGSGPYTFTVSRSAPTADGTLTLRVAASAAVDAAGNESATSTTRSYTIDTTAPTASWTATPGSLTNDANLVYTLVFDESVTGLTAADLTIGGTATGYSAAVTGSGTTYTVTLSGGGVGTVSLLLESGSVSDAATNSGPASNTAAATITVDRTAPAVSSFAPTTATPTNNASIAYALVFDEAVTGLAAGDLAISGTATGYSAAVAGSGTTYTITLSGGGDGTVILALDAGGVSDATGNTGPASGSTASTVTVDRTAPAVSSFAPTTSTPTNGTSIAYSLVFDEAVTGLVADDISLSGTSHASTAYSVAVSGSGTTYTITLTQADPADGTVVATLDAGAVNDAAGNAGPASSSTAATVTVDRTAPTVSVFTAPATPTKATSLAYTLAFSESVTGLAAGDVTIGGTATGWSAAITGSGSAYTVTLTGGTAGTVILTLGATSVADAAGNSGPSSTSAAATVTVDRTAPTISAFTAPASPSSSSTLSYSLTFSESVTGVTAADFSIGGTASGWSIDTVTGSGTSYTISLTSAAGDDGTVVLTIAAGAASDAATNSGPAVAIDAAAVTVDRNGPTVASFASTTSSPTTLTSISYALVFDESVTGLAVGDFTIGGTSHAATPWSAAVTGSGTTYTVTLTRDTPADGTVTLALGASSVTDGIGNIGPAAETTAAEVTVDRTVPTATWTASPSTPTGDTTLVYTLAFSEAVSGLSDADFTLTGTSSGWSVESIEGSGPYTVTIGAVDPVEGTVVLTLGGGTVSDIAGNTGPSANRSATSVRLDRVVPTATITLSPNGSSGPVSTSAIGVTVNWSEAVSDFAPESAVVTNGTVSNFVTVSATRHTFTITPDVDGVVDLEIIAGAAIDSAGNPSDPAGASIEIDRSGPNAMFEFDPATDPTNAASIVATITFDELPVGLTLSDFVVVNGSASSIGGSGAIRTLILTPAADGELRLTLPAGAIADGAGNVSTNATTAATTIDRTAPTLAMAFSPSADPTNASTITVTITASEAVTDLVGPDLVLTNATLLDFEGSGTSYSATIEPNGDGTVVVALDAAAAVDPAGNTTAAVSRSVAVDRTAPTATVTRDTNDDPTSAADATLTITWSETVSGFVVGDLLLENATASNFALVGTTATVRIAPIVDGEVRVTLPAGVAADAAGNTSDGEHLLTWTADRTAPGVTLARTPADSPTNAAEITLTITFDEPVTGLTLDDLAVTNGVATDLSGSGAEYVATITPTADGVVAVTIANGAAFDAAGNASTSGSTSLISDRSGPVATMTRSPSATPSNAGSFVLTISYDETALGLDLADLIVDNGVGSDLAGDGTSYTLTVTPTADGTVSVSLPSGAVEDEIGNASDAATLAWVSDRTAPTATIGDGTVTATSGVRLDVPVDFSEPITGLTAADFTVSGTAGWTATAVSGAGDAWTVTVRGIGTGTVAVALNADAVIDAATNSSDAVAAVEVAVVDRAGDTSPPELSLTISESNTGLSTSDTTLYYRPSTAFGAAFVVTAEVVDDSGSVTSVDFDAVPNAGSGNDASGGEVMDPPYAHTYTIGRAPTASATITVSAMDGAGNAGSASFAVIPDAVVPTTSLAAVGGNIVESPLVELAISALDALSGVATCELSITGQPYTVVACSGTIPVTLPDRDGSHLVALRATDNVGNVTIRTMTVDLDRAAPTLSGYTFTRLAGRGIAATGSTLYFGPAAAASGARVAIGARVTDGVFVNGVAVVDFEALTTADRTIEATSDTSAPFAIELAFTPALPDDLVATSGAIATDRLANVSERAEYTIVGDATAPAIEATGVTGWVPGSAVTITVTASDLGAGLGACETRIDALTWRSFRCPTGEEPVSVALAIDRAGGARTIAVRATDRVGNETTVELPFDHDPTAPLIGAPVLTAGGAGIVVDAGAAVPTAWYNPVVANGATLTVEYPVSDGESGVERVEFPLVAVTSGAPAPEAVTAAPYTATYTLFADATVDGLTEPGRAFDIAGNAAIAGRFAVRRDTVAPTATLEIDEGAETTVIRDVSAAVYAVDALSGIASCELSVGGGAYVSATCDGATTVTLPATIDVATTVTLRVRDLVGNETTVDQSITLSSDGFVATAGRAAGQAAITATGPAIFSVSFPASVPGFGADDIEISGTATGATVLSVTGGPRRYVVLVDTTGDGTVTLGVRDDFESSSGEVIAGTMPNDASLRTVTFDRTAPDAVASDLTFDETSATIDIDGVVGEVAVAGDSNAITPTLFIGKTSGNDTVTVTIANPVDAASGIDRVEFPNLAGSGIVAVGALVDTTAPYSATYTVKKTAKATKLTAPIIVRDIAGNATEIRGWLTIAPDTVFPTAAPRRSSGLTTGRDRAIEIQPVFSDVGAGLASCAYGLDGATWTSTSCDASAFTATVPEGEGTKSIWIRATDGVGNNYGPRRILIGTIDTTAPTIESIAPASGAVLTNTRARIVVAFSEPVSALLDGALRLYGPDGVRVPGIVRFSGTRVTFEPTETLAIGAGYLIAIGEDVRDLAGNHFAGTAAGYTVIAGAPAAALGAVSATVSRAEGMGGTGAFSPVVFAVRFSRSVLPAADWATSSEGTVVATTGAGATWLVAVRPDADGAVSMDIDASKIDGFTGITGSVPAISVERSGPQAPSVVVSESSPAMVYEPGRHRLTYGPAAAGSAAFTVTVTAGDVTTLNFPTKTGMTRGAISNADGTFTTTYSFNAGTTVVSGAMGQIIAVDAAGNASRGPNWLTIFRDSTPPRVSIGVTGSATVSSAGTVRLAVNAVDDGIGVESCALSNNGATWTTVACSDAVLWTPPAFGSVYARAIDRVGNVKVATIILRRDTVVPTTSFAGAPANGATGVSLRPIFTVAFSEQVSGAPTEVLIIAPDGTRVPLVNRMVGASIGGAVTPVNALRPNTRYLLVVTGGIRDAAGNRAAPVYRWFTTGR